MHGAVRCFGNAPDDILDEGKPTGTLSTQATLMTPKRVARHEAKPISAYLFKYGVRDGKI